MVGTLLRYAPIPLSIYEYPSSTDVSLIIPRLRTLMAESYPSKIPTALTHPERIHSHDLQSRHLDVHSNGNDWSLSMMDYGPDNIQTRSFLDDPDTICPFHCGTHRKTSGFGVLLTDQDATICADLRREPRPVSVSEPLGRNIYRLMARQLKV